MTAVHVNNFVMDPRRNNVLATVHGTMALDVAPAVALHQQDTATLDDRDGAAGNVGVSQRGRHHAIDEGFELGGIPNGVFVEGRTH